jgi:metal-dependent amidase/aminoacylase/carboxypeptidase family protein
VCATFGATAEVEWIPGSPAVVNDVDACARFGRVARKVVGEANVDDHADQIMGGDDMALFLQRAPGCYFFVGGRGSDASSFPHHHPKFDLDEACLPVAVELFAAGIVDLLGPERS